MMGWTHIRSCLKYDIMLLVSSSLRRGRGSHSSIDVWCVGVWDGAGVDTDSWLRASKSAPGDVDTVQLELVRWSVAPAASFK
jgi:hypothetical protein